MLESPPPPLDELAPAALFLDFDGTLVELADTPDAITVPDRLHTLLEGLSKRLDGRLAIVSGRAIEALDRHLRRPAIALSGSHGAELRLADGTVLPLAVPEGVDRVRAEVEALAAADPRLIVEHKPAGVALHFRQAPERESELCAKAGELAERTGLAIQNGKMVVELRPHGADKGEALRRLMMEPPFAGTRPLFVGDDLTDEHAFAAAAALGGSGILVGPARDSAARWRLDDVASALRWLEPKSGDELVETNTRG
ncbi:MAG TPA: trehalose-phosphatase [Allosphingosinicella sp.]